MLNLYDSDGERKPGPPERGDRAAVRHVSGPAAAGRGRGTYLLVQKDPAPYREQIIALWKEYLPGTPAGRFDWMSHGNPAGPALWFFAVDTRNDEIAGVISVIPREMIMGGRRVRAGILGDFMVSRKHRVFGPGLLLPKTAVTELSERGFEVFYTVPNTESEKIIRRVGFGSGESLYSMVKPLEVEYYLEKCMDPVAARLLSPLIRNGLALLSGERYITARGTFEEVVSIGIEFDALWEEMRPNRKSVRGDHSAKYLAWRYLRDPLCRYRVLTYRKNPAGKILGCLFFVIDGGRLHIADIMTTGAAPACKLLKRIAMVAREEGCLSLTMEIGRTNPLLPLVRSFGFFNAHKDIALFSLGGPGNGAAVCGFMGGDWSL